MGVVGPVAIRPNLRKPQLDALAAIASFVKARQRRRLLTVLPTGVGKTMTFAQSASWLRKFAGIRTRKILVLAHREELLRQAAKTFALCNPKARVGIHQGAKRCDPAEYDVIVASVQSIARETHLAAFGKADFQLLIIDEAHHATEDSTYGDVVRYFNGFEEHGPLVLGWTATPNRGDGRSLSGLFEDVAYSLTLEYCITAGYLVPAFLRPVPIDADLLSLGGSKRRDFKESQLASMMDNPGITFAMLTRYEQETQLWFAQTGKRHKTIAFAVTRAHAQHITEACREMGITAAYLGGDLSDEERQQRLTDFAEDRFEMLVSVNLLLEGFDQPDITCAVDLKPTRSLVLATQEFGRILRLSPGKASAVYLQAVPAHAEVAGMIRAQDLFGLQTDDSPLTQQVMAHVPLHQMAEELTHLREARELFATLAPEMGEEEGRPWTAAERQSVIDRMLAIAPEAILQLAETMPEGFRTSDVVWHARADGVFYVDLGDGQQLHLTPPDLLGRAVVTAWSDHGPVSVGTTDDLDEGRRMAERWLVREHPEASRLVLKSQAGRWMAKQATAGQLARLRTLMPETTPETLRRITRGVAHHLINHFLARQKLGVAEAA